MVNMEKEIIDVFKNKINDIIGKLDCIIESYMEDYNESTISRYINEKVLWKWCLDILSETEREIYNKEKE